MTRAEAVGRLKTWGNYLNIITGLDEDIREIRKAIEYNRGVRALALKNVPSSKNISKPTENTAIKNIDDCENEIQEIENQIKAVKKNKEEIDNFITTLELTEQRLLRVRYVRKKSWEAVSMKIHLSNRQCYRVHNKILKIMSDYFETPPQAG
ncbi:MAG: hypothetical protein LUD81_10035 [Clostridiales bacterium]|nr:hypothetical protein [Clostridiales bacterium]